MPIPSSKCEVYIIVILFSTNIDSVCIGPCRLELMILYAIFIWNPIIQLILIFEQMCTISCERFFKYLSLCVGDWCRWPWFYTNVLLALYGLSAFSLCIHNNFADVNIDRYKFNRYFYKKCYLSALNFKEIRAFDLVKSKFNMKNMRFYFSSLWLLVLRFLFGCVYMRETDCTFTYYTCRKSDEILRS